MPGAAAQAAYLLIPDSINKRVMKLDATSGDVLEPRFIEDAARFGTIVHVLPNFDSTGVFISDQVADVVWEYSAAGEFVRVFAPAGGANTAILDNIRGMAYDPAGERLLVTVAGSDNSNAVVAFDAQGTYLGQVVAAGSNGLSSPWSVLYSGDDLLVGASGTSSVLRYTHAGVPVDTFATPINFPQQMALAANGNVLVANFSPADTRGYYEYTPEGAPVGFYALPALQGAPRGVHELPGGTLLVSTSAGVYEIDREGTILSTKITGGQYRFISRVPLAGATTPGEADAAPAAFALAAPAPNPAAGQTAIRLTVPQAQTVRVDVYDLLGRRVRTLHDGPAAAGTLALAVDAATLAPGVYVVRASGPAAEAAVRLVVTR